MTLVRAGARPGLQPQRIPCGFAYCLASRGTSVLLDQGGVHRPQGWHPRTSIRPNAHGGPPSRPDRGSLPPRPRPAPPLEAARTGCPRCAGPRTARRRPTCRVSTSRKPVKSVRLPSRLTSLRRPGRQPHTRDSGPPWLPPPFSPATPAYPAHGCPLARGHWPTPRPGVFAWRGP